MKKSTTNTGRKLTGPVPPGGRALERVKQDRLARGLAAPRPPGRLELDDSPSPKRRGSTAATKKRRSGR